MPTNRLQNRIAWDHTVLLRSAPRLERRNEQRRAASAADAGHPVATVFLAWALIAWSGLTAWALWTRNNAEAHVAMRFLMRGDVEEILGVIVGLGWACIPAWAAFFMARHVRVVTTDDLGGRAYWTSLVVSIIAALGILRPTWDPQAGSRFARVSPAPAAAPSADTTQTQTSADDGSYDASYHDGVNATDLGTDVAVLDNMHDTGESVEDVLAMAAGHTPGPDSELDTAAPAGASHPLARLTRSRYAAMLRAMAEQPAATGATYATVDTPDSPE